jgi:hypothetical protein
LVDVLLVCVVAFFCLLRVWDDKQNSIERGKLLDRIQAPQFVMGNMPEPSAARQLSDEEEWAAEQSARTEALRHASAYTPDDYLDMGFKKEDD